MPEQLGLLLGRVGQLALTGIQARGGLHPLPRAACGLGYQWVSCSFFFFLIIKN